MLIYSISCLFLIWQNFFKFFTLLFIFQIYLKNYKITISKIVPQQFQCFNIGSNTPTKPKKISSKLVWKMWKCENYTSRELLSGNPKAVISANERIERNVVLYRRYHSVEFTRTVAEAENYGNKIQEIQRYRNVKKWKII